VPFIVTIWWSHRQCPADSQNSLYNHDDGRLNRSMNSMVAQIKTLPIWGLILRLSSIWQRRHNSSLQHTPLDEDNADIVGFSCYSFELKSKWAILGSWQYRIQWVTHTDLRQESSTGQPGFVGECYYTGFWTEYCGVDLPDLGRNGPIERWQILWWTFQIRRIRYRLLRQSKKFPALYNTWSYITAFTEARLSAVKCIHSSPNFFKIHINPLTPNNF